MDLRAVIMAGGSGTRFWPLSRARKPKQFLEIASDKSMIRETVDRIRPLVPPRRILTVANAAQTRLIRRLLPALPVRNLIVEPAAKNTAPSLILATAQVYLRNPRAVVAALPADHLILDSALFRRKLEAAAAAAEAGDVIATFGIPPTHPATGYGYIHFARGKPERSLDEPFYRVLGFKEKPDSSTARRFLEEGCYWWNSGMFLWRAEVLARKLEAFAPDLYVFWPRILDALRTGRHSALRTVFKDMPATSIDFGLMEKADGVLVAKGDFGWSDVGAWSSLAEVWPKDAAGNAFKGQGLAVDARGCLVYNPRRLTALVGVSDLVVVETDDALLICRKDQDQKVKDIVEVLRKTGRLNLL